MEHEDINKTKRQLFSLQKWENNNCRGTLNLTMRFGKTRIIQIACSKRVDKKILALAHNDIACKNLIDNSIPMVRSYREFLNDNSLQETVWDLVIIDEIHKTFIGEIPIIFDKIKSIEKLGLTGSKLSYQQRNYLASKGFPIVDTITQEEALENNWIAGFKEYNIPIELDNNSLEKYITYSNHIHETMELVKNVYLRVNKVENINLFNSDFDMVYSMFTGKNVLDNTGKNVFIKPNILRLIVSKVMGFNSNLNENTPNYLNICKYWNPEALYDRAKLFKEHVRLRNDIINNNRYKLNAVIDILKHFNNRKTIIFNESIEMVDMLVNHLDKAVPYHSRMESRYIYEGDKPITYSTGQKAGEPKLFGKETFKKIAIQGLKSGDFKTLVTANCLNEALSISEIDMIITTAGTTNHSTYEQRNARGKTVDIYNPNKEVIIINLFIDNITLPNGKIVLSRDRQKLEARQKESSHNIIWLKELKELFINNS